MFIKFTIAVLTATLLSSSALAQTEVSVLRVEIADEVQKGYYADLATAYEKANPDVKINLKYIANEAYKTKLPTLLQSDARPDVFYSWSGLTLVEQAEAGFLRDISGVVSEETLGTIPEGTVEAYRVNGELVGLPLYAAEVVFWVNTALTEKAGVDHTSIKTWGDFLAAVKTLKDAGITPIIAGGQDKWPLHFYWSFLALREGGADTLPMATGGEGEGFLAEPFVKAGEKFQQLVELEPFQPGFMSTNFKTATSLFSNDKAAFHLMGEWAYSAIQDQASKGAPLADENLGVFSFPIVEGGADNEGRVTLGGINGWAVTKDAPDEAVAYMEFMLEQENQRKAAELGIYIPITGGAEDGISNPYFKKIAEDLSNSEYHQIFLDQFLGASVGATVNDVSADLAAKVISPEEAAKQVQEAWDFR